MTKKHPTARLVGVLALVAGGSVARAIDFTNVDIQAPPLSNGSFFSTTATSISVLTPNAIVGDFQVSRSGTLSVEYDASNVGGLEMTSVRVDVNLGNPCSGSGTIAFLEEIFELDANGNQIGMIGSLSHPFDPNSGILWSETIQFSRGVQRFHARKSFVLDATADTGAFDIASLALVEQTVGVVPEPTTMATMAVGVLVTLAHRRRKSRNL